jgi:hypothetical protein
VSAKDTVRALLDRLPNDCSLDDVLYHLYVVQAVGRGLSDGQAGRTIPHEQVAADLRRKWLLGSATQSGSNRPEPNAMICETAIVDRTEWSVTMRRLTTTGAGGA